jgi:hypothetical protein
MRRWRSVITGLLACLALLAGAADAEAQKPIVLSLSVTPRVLLSSGGEVTITAHVRDAIDCTVYAEGMGAPRRLNCSSGRLSYRRHVPANGYIYPDLRSVYIVAYNGRLHTRSKEINIKVLPPGSGISPVAGVEGCTAGPECDYGPIHDTFPTYGNTTTLGDCTFAAAADWEQMILGDEPEPEQIAYEFGAAGGTEDGGLSQTAFMNYWRKDGIGGVKAASFERFYTAPEDVRNGVGDYAAMIVALDFTEGTYFGTEKMTAGTHEAVVDGFTPDGPLIVTWGRTVQITWEQWEDEVTGMWRVILE